MMKTKAIYFALILGVLSVLPAQAQVLFTEEGQLVSVNSNSINLNDAKLRLSPTVKVILENNEKGEIANLARGDTVRASVIRLNGRLLVDTIRVIPRMSPNENTVGSDEQ